jgi:hypothetical protein
MATDFHCQKLPIQITFEITSNMDEEMNLNGKFFTSNICKEYIWVIIASKFWINEL